MAAQLGADAVDPRETDLAAYTRDTYGDGADVSFEASGAGAVTLKAAVAAVRNGGTIVMVASSHGEVPIDLNTIMNSQKRLVGTLAYTNEDFAEVITAIADGTLDPSPLVSSTISLDDASEKGLNHLLGEGRNSEVKILVRPY